MERKYNDEAYRERPQSTELVICQWLEVGEIDKGDAPGMAEEAAKYIVS